MKIFKTNVIAVILASYVMSFAPILHAEAATNQLPLLVSERWQDLQVVGQTRMKKFGLHIYDATLWASKDNQGSLACAHTCALSIVYARNISTQRLVSVTEKEWAKLGLLSKGLAKQWAAQLTELWPEVKQGDQLIMVKNPDGSGTFYSQEELLGTIADPQFAHHFLAIWLDPKSRYQKHRKELINE